MGDNITGRMAGRIRRTALLLCMLMLCLGMAVPVQAKTGQVTMRVGQKKQLTVKKSWKKVKWKSSKPGIVSVSSKGRITAKKPGKAVITALSGSKKKKFTVTVKKNEKSRMTISVNGKTFLVELESNKTAEAFLKMSPMTLKMEELNGNEKYHYLDRTLPSGASCPGTIHAGDLMLYGSDCVVLFYKTFRTGYSYTRIGHIKDTGGLQEALGTGAVTVLFQK